jgi:hypothetical protein
MGITQKLKAAMKLLKEIGREYDTMTRKNKCIPSKNKRVRMSKRSETKKSNRFSNSNSNSKTKSVRFNKPLTNVEPEEQMEPVEPVVEPSVPNPFEEPETEVEPEAEPEAETNPLDDGLTKL